MWDMRPADMRADVLPGDGSTAVAHPAPRIPRPAPRVLAFDLRLEPQTNSGREDSMRKADVHCTFCDLIHGAGEASICYEDSDALAFMDIQPVNAGHVLVVPRQHHESLVDTPPELAMHLFEVSMKLASVIRKVTNCDDMNIVVNSGKTAGQDVFHYHVHLIPRREEDGFDIPLPFGGSEMPDRTLLDAMAVQIIAALRDPVRGHWNGHDGVDDHDREIPAPADARVA